MSGREIKGEGSGTVPRHYRPLIRIPFSSCTPDSDGRVPGVGGLSFLSASGATARRDSTAAYASRDLPLAGTNGQLLSLSRLN